VAIGVAVVAEARTAVVARALTVEAVEVLAVAPNSLPTLKPARMFRTGFLFWHQLRVKFSWPRLPSSRVILGTQLFQPSSVR
jgi:hypothetical protein